MNYFPDGSESRHERLGPIQCHVVTETRSVEDLNVKLDVAQAVE